LARFTGLLRAAHLQAFAANQPPNSWRPLGYQAVDEWPEFKISRPGKAIQR